MPKESKRNMPKNKRRGPVRVMEKMNNDTKKVSLIITLEGVKQLNAEKVTSYLRNGVVINEEVQKKRFPLHKVSEEKLLELRIAGKPGFVAKYEGKYYYTPIPKNMRFVTQTTMWKHVCGKSGAECSRLSAASDEDGGCAKVRDLTVENYLSAGYELREAVILSKRIEKYDFITMGFESFNTAQDSFVVAACEHYKKEEKKEHTGLSVYHTKLALAQYVWPELSREEIREKLRGGKYKEVTE